MKKVWPPPSCSGSTNVLCESKVVFPPSVAAGLGCCFHHAPHRRGAVVATRLAGLGFQPVRPDISMYVAPAERNSAGPSPCGPSPCQFHVRGRTRMQTLLEKHCSSQGSHCGAQAWGGWGVPALQTPCHVLAGMPLEGRVEGAWHVWCSGPLGSSHVARG